MTTDVAQLAFEKQENKPEISDDPQYGIDDRLFDLLLVCFDTFKNNGVERFGALEIASWIEQYASINDGAVIPKMFFSSRSIGRALSFNPDAYTPLGIEASDTQNNRRMWRFK